MQTAVGDRPPSAKLQRCYSPGPRKPKPVPGPAPRALAYTNQVIARAINAPWLLSGTVGDGGNGGAAALASFQN
jgi:hypothetical protein